MTVGRGQDLDLGLGCSLWLTAGPFVCLELVKGAELRKRRAFSPFGVNRSDITSKGFTAEVSWKSRDPLRNGPWQEGYFGPNGASPSSCYIHRKLKKRFTRRSV